MKHGYIYRTKRKWIERTGYYSAADAPAADPDWVVLPRILGFKMWLRSFRKSSELGRMPKHFKRTVNHNTGEVEYEFHTENECTREIY